MPRFIGFSITENVNAERHQVLNRTFVCNIPVHESRRHLNWSGAVAGQLDQIYVQEYLCSAIVVVLQTNLLKVHMTHISHACTQARTNERTREHPYIHPHWNVGQRWCLMYCRQVLGLYRASWFPHGLIVLYGSYSWLSILANHTVLSASSIFWRVNGHVARS